MDKYQTQYDNECYALGMMMRDNTLLEETQLQAKHFLNPHNKNLFLQMKELHAEGKPADMIALSQLDEGKQFGFGGVETLSYVYGLGVQGERFDYFQRSIVEFVAVEEAIQQMKEFYEKTKYAHNVGELHKIVTKLNGIQINTLQPQLSFQEKLKKRMEYHRSLPSIGMSGTPTGFDNLDRVFDGYQNGDLIVVAARPSVGKTAFVLDSMRRASANKNYQGTFFSCEMGVDSVIDRLIGMEGKIPIMAVRNPNKFFLGRDEYWKKYYDACGELTKRSIDIRNEKTLHDIRSAIRKTVQEHPTKKHLFAIDHLGHVKTNQTFQSKHAEFTYIINEVKEMAVEFNVPIITIAQLNRNVEGKQDKAPSMSDIRESGSIEEVADVIMFPHREAYFDRQKREAEEIHDVELIIAKNRNGFVGSRYFQFVQKTNLFREVTK